MSIKQLTIAIDGLTGTGKGTTARGVAKQLGYIYLDTGAMYRAVTLYAVRNGLVHASDEQKEAMMKDIKLDFEYNSATDQHDMILNGENVEMAIRETEFATYIRYIASVPGIRKKLGQLQYRFGEQGGIVADGRDMGTVVFPAAEIKVFLICDLETRVERRFEQLQKQGLNADKDEIRKEIQIRDEADYLGENAINKQAEDAITLDTTDLTIDEQVGRIVSLVKEKII